MRDVVPDLVQRLARIVPTSSRQRVLAQLDDYQQVKEQRERLSEDLRRRTQAIIEELDQAIEAAAARDAASQ